MPQGGAVCFIFLPKSYSCPPIHRRSMDMANAKVDGAAALHDWWRPWQLVLAGRCRGAGKFDAAGWGSLFYFSAQIIFLPADSLAFVGHGERESRSSSGVARLVATLAISFGRKMWRGRKMGRRRVGHCVLSFCPNLCSCPPIHRRSLDMASARVEGAAALHDRGRRRQLVLAGRCRGAGRWDAAVWGSGFIFLPKSCSCQAIYRRSLDMANARVEGAAALHDWSRRRQLVWARRCGRAGRWHAGGWGQYHLFSWHAFWGFCSPNSMRVRLATKHRLLGLVCE